MNSYSHDINFIFVSDYRGAFDGTPSPRSVSLLRSAYEPKERGAQDDSVVYSESKSRTGARLRPQRRGESFR